MKKNHLLPLLALLLLPLATLAQWDEVTIKTTPLRDSIYLLEGRGGNILASIGPDGVFMIDAQFAPLSDKILAAIDTLTDRPLRCLFNTHWHGDHTGGNANMQAAGALIVAHDNVRERMSTTQYMRSMKRTVPPSPAEALPVVTFAEDIGLHFNGQEVIGFHAHTGAHTDGDAFVYFLQANIIHTGDVFFSGKYPFIDRSSGGHIDGIIAFCDAILMLANEETILIPGHGPISKRSDLVTYVEMLRDLRSRVQLALQAQKSLEEVLAADLTATYPAAYGQGFINEQQVITFIYESLAGE